MGLALYGPNESVIQGLAAQEPQSNSKSKPNELEPNENRFASKLVPFLKDYCGKCHSGGTPEADLSFDAFGDSANIQEKFEVWSNVRKMLASGEMPPKSERQPNSDQRQEMLLIVDSELAKFDCGQQRHTGRVTIRRLNRVEYNNTIRDLVGVDFSPADDFPSDDVGYGFDNIGVVLSIPPILLEKYLTAAERIMDRVLLNSANRERLNWPPESADPNEQAERVRNFVARFAMRAFRRPLAGDELDRLAKFADSIRSRGGTLDDSLSATCVAILVSPHFLFRVELDPDPQDPDGVRELNDYEIASRLSYFLWSTMPDEQLFEQAKLGILRQPKILAEQTRRLLQDPRCALVKNFAGQWLQLRDLKNLTPDPERFPDFDEELRASMLAETETFFSSVVRDDRSVLEFLTADYSFVNQRLARHYGIPNVNGSTFERVSMGENRRGILTQGSILLLTSNPTRTSPVKRGKWILENILGDPPPPPPPNVEELKEEGELLGSLRERMEQHRENESCAVCHRKMDTLGFGLENFDAIGSWRDRDGTAEIDASGTLPGQVEFRGPKDLMTILAKERAEDFCRCLASKMLTYALGRGLTSDDRCTVDSIIARLKNDDYRFSAMIEAIVTSDPFLNQGSSRAE